MGFEENYLENVKFEFQRYKTYGDKTFDQLSPEEMHWQYSNDDNSIAIIIKHMTGNMLSRWTNFLLEDGEKTWRNRETEFEDPPKEKNELLKLWEKGWNCLFQALDTVSSSNFDNKITIRGEHHTITEAINRQLAHYASHVGQIVLLGKMIKASEWVSLSIPKGESKAYNQRMLGKS